MAILIKVMTWNIAHASLTGELPPNKNLPLVVEQIRSKNPDIVLLNEVKHWDLDVGGWIGGYVNQTKRIAEMAEFPYCQWGQVNRTGWTGHICVSILSRFPLGSSQLHPIMHGDQATGYGILESSFTINNIHHKIFSLRFDHEKEADNIAAHQQMIALLQNRNPESTVLLGGDFNANQAEDPHFVEFIQNSGLTDAYLEHPDPVPPACIGEGGPQALVDHIFFHGPYKVTQMEIRCPWADGDLEVSDHPWVFTELCSPPLGFTATYGATLKLKHFATGHILHSHAHTYGHSGSSGQQQVTAFAGFDDNDLWRIKGSHGEPEDSRTGQPIQDGDIIRLEHVLTRHNLHSHSGFPSPVTEQQEVSCFGENGIGDGNDNWRIEIEGGGTLQSGRRFRLIHSATNHALHSHMGISDPQWTMEQQEVTAFPERDDNDWWYLFELRSEQRIPLLIRVEPSALPLGRPVSLSVSVTTRDTGGLIPGKVRIDNTIVADANTPFTYTFTDESLRGWVIVNGYPDQEIPFRFVTYSVGFRNIMNGIGGDQL